MTKAIAILQAVLAFIGFTFIGLVFYSELSSPFSIIALFVFVLTGAYAGLKVYRMISRRGYLSTVSGDNASYELDDLQPTKASGVLDLSPQDLANIYAEGKNTLGMVTVAIWGDWKGRKLNAKHEIGRIRYQEENHTLTIYFTSHCELKITKPSVIHYCDTYLKIIDAVEVSWHVPSKDEALASYHYSKQGSNIITDSNTSWKPMAEDLGIGMHAVYLQG